MNDLTPDAIHQIASDRRRDAQRAADAHRATRGHGRRHRRADWFGRSSLRLLPRAGSPLDPTIARPGQA